MKAIFRVFSTETVDSSTGERKFDKVWLQGDNKEGTPAIIEMQISEPGMFDYLQEGDKVEIKIEKL